MSKWLGKLWWLHCNIKWWCTCLKQPGHIFPLISFWFVLNRPLLLKWASYISSISNILCMICINRKSYVPCPMARKLFKLDPCFKVIHARTFQPFEIGHNLDSSELKSASDLVNKNYFQEVWCIYRPWINFWNAECCALQWSDSLFTKDCKKWIAWHVWK